MEGKVLAVICLLAAAIALSGCLEPAACTEEAKMCPDGSFVSRNPELGCRFDPCPEPVACAADVKICEDGSSVSRNPALNCDFDPCPEGNCADQGEEFSETLECCPGLVKAVSTCEKCRGEGEPLAFDGIPCCDGLEALDGFCRKPGEELPCRKEGETIPVIASPPECCEGLELIPPKEENILGVMGYCTAKCGNGACDQATESAYNCPQDCQVQETCGDGICQDTTCAAIGCPIAETPENCPQDCLGECRPEDYMCTPLDMPCCEGLKEVSLTVVEGDECIAAECGTICQPCGNGVCDSRENWCNCPEDCGQELELCGNGLCDASETEASCEQDCNGCFEMTNLALENLKSEIEKVHEDTGYISYTSFYLSGCFEKGAESVRIMDFLEPDCEDACGEYMGLCLLLEYTNSEHESYNMKKCLDASADTAFLLEGETCVAWPDYKLENFRESVPEGEYMIGRKSGLDYPISVFCAYRET